MSHRGVHCPSRPPQLPRNRTAGITHPPSYRTPQGSFHTVVLNWRKRTKCLLLHRTVPSSRTICAVSFDMYLWQPQSGHQNTKRAVSLLKILRLSACPRKTGNGGESELKSYRGGRAVSTVQTLKIMHGPLLLTPGLIYVIWKLPAKLSAQMNCCESIPLNEFNASSELGTNPLILTFWLKNTKCRI